MTRWTTCECSRKGSGKTMEAMRERSLVGLFVLIAGGLLLGTMIVISGGMGVATAPYRAYFKFAGGVQPGAPVRYGGVLVGKGRGVRPGPRDTPAHPIQP